MPLSGDVVDVELEGRLQKEQLQKEQMEVAGYDLVESVRCKIWGEVDRWNLGLTRDQVRVFFRDHSCAASD